MSGAFRLATTYIHLAADERAKALVVDDDFWAMIAQRRDLDGGRLMGIFDQTADWPTWERHPAGEEVLTMLSGEMELILDEDGAERRVALPVGHTFIVPRGVWHTAIVRKPGQLLFVTPGAGTEHRPVRL